MAIVMHLSTAVRPYDRNQLHSAPLNAYRAQRLYYQSMSDAEQAEHRSATAHWSINFLGLFKGSNHLWYRQTFTRTSHPIHNFFKSLSYHHHQQ